jgi:hypothetical protein
MSAFLAPIGKDVNAIPNGFQRSTKARAIEVFQGLHWNKMRRFRAKHINAQTATRRCCLVSQALSSVSLQDRCDGFLRRINASFLCSARGTRTVCSRF